MKLLWGILVISFTNLYVIIDMWIIPGQVATSFVQLFLADLIVLI